ncbi:MAG TPA: hypothetical protein VH682_07415 [Gemmataceae bacterium]|jgi:hypothetical protein
MRTTKKKSGPFRLGDWVSFLYGVESAIAQVIELRGPLGFKGRHVYRLRFAGDSDDTNAFELSEDSLEAAPLPDKEAIVNYLKEGGLVAILFGNLEKKREQPKAWLTYKRRGGVTHTFLAERGVVGGAPIPYFALHEEKVYTGKKEEVAAFLTTFGISRTEAEAILAAVGTAP